MLFCSRDFFLFDWSMYVLALAYNRVTYKIISFFLSCSRRKRSSSSKKKYFFCPQLRKKNCSELWEYIKMCCALLYVLRLTNYSLLLYNTTLADIRVLLHTCNNNITYRKKCSLCIFLPPPLFASHTTKNFLSFSLVQTFFFFSRNSFSGSQHRGKRINNYNCDLLFV